MKTIFKLTKEAARYKGYYFGAIFATLCLTLINLAAPRVLSLATGMISAGITEESLKSIYQLGLILLFLYLGRVIFRFMNNYLAHFAAWQLVGNLRQRLYESCRIPSFLMPLSQIILPIPHQDLPGRKLSKRLSFLTFMRISWLCLLSMIRW